MRGAVKTLSRDSPSGSQSRGTEQGTVIAIPEKAVPASVLIEKMKAMKQQEMAFENGKGFAYTYVSDAQMEDLATCLQAAYESFAEKSGASAKHDDLLANAWRLFMHTNALNPTVYKSLRQFETEIVSMTAWLMHGDSKVAGSLTSGGTESIIMAVKTYRDRAKKLYPNIRRPNIIACITVHPAFEKAVHLLDMEIIHVPMRSDCRMDVTATKKAINRSTILLVGSAPQYCHGVVDPIEEISELALANNLPLHVDACFGGFMLPWLEKLNYKVPLFDFRVPGVTSISADVHKYGYSSKGASIVLYKTAELRSYQYFAYTEWPGGLFGSPSLAGKILFMIISIDCVMIF